MTTYYNHNPKFYVGIDCIIFGFDKGELNLLLLKRNFEPAMGQWSLMGGFIQENESADDAAKRVLSELTGLENVYMDQIGAFGAVDRDPGERVISLAYYALINIENHNAELIQNYHAQWFNVADAPKLIFDHDSMVRHAIRRLRYRTSTKPVGFELLPEKFTMRQLLELYEAILDKELDKRNFISKINSLDILVKLDEKNMQSSRKGSYLYTFDKEKYDAKSLNDFVLNL